MKITTALKKGISLVTQNVKMIGIIYIVNISLALILSIPMFVSLNGSVGKTAFRDQLSQNFSYDWWTEFDFHAHGLEKTIRPSLSGGFGPLFDNLELLLTGMFTSFGIWIFVFAITYLILAAFLNGGVIGLFADEKRSFTVSRFFSYSGYYFHHLFALALTSVLAFFLIYKFLSPALFSLVDGITSGWMVERSVWFVNLLAYIILLFIVMVVNMILDYAKIIVIVEKKNSSWLCIWLGLKFLARRFFRAFGLYAMLAAIALGLVIVFGAILSIINPSQIFLLIIAFTFQQIFIFVKIWSRLNFYGAQLLFYNHEHSTVRKLKKV